MAIKILSFDGVVNPVSADYPRGDIKDNPGGTRVNRKSNADMIQFFSKLMADASITPNDTPDNVANGYQLMEALLNVQPFSSAGITFVGVGSNLWGNAGGGTYNVGYRKFGHVLHLCGAAINSALGSPVSSFVFTLPAGFRPTSKVSFIGLATGIGPIQIDISTAGDVTSVTPVSGSSVIYFDNISFRVD